MANDFRFFFGHLNCEQYRRRETNKITNVSFVNQYTAIKIRNNKYTECRKIKLGELKNAVIDTFILSAQFEMKWNQERDSYL